MKVLLLTPYSPLLHHDHAANDLMLPLVKTLSPLMDLHVYAPGQRNGELKRWRYDGVTYYAGSQVHRTQLDRLGTYPFSARGSWSRQSTREALAIAHDVRPDILHAEYDQAAEPLLRSRLGVPTSVMLHDLPGEIASPPRVDASHLRYWLQRLERAKTRRAKHAIVNSIDALLVFSERDRNKVPNARGLVEVSPVGLTPPATGWLGDRLHTAAFGGAMWRLENEVTAVYLAREVMPLVRRQVSDAELRIFGSRPTANVRALGNEPGVTVVGEVADYDDEFRRAGVSLAPTMVAAGVLIKALRAMAMGCPVILNSASASSIVGLETDVHALVGDGAEDLAAQLVAAMKDSARARQLGLAAMELVRENYSWQNTADVYYNLFNRLLQHSSGT